MTDNVQVIHDRSLLDRADCWLALLVLLAVFLARFRWFASRSFNPDEFQHFYAVWCASRGMLPFRDFFQNYTPWFHYLLSPLFAMSHMNLHSAAAADDLSVIYAIISLRGGVVPVLMQFAFGLSYYPFLFGCEMVPAEGLAAAVTAAILWMIVDHCVRRNPASNSATKPQPASSSRP